MPDHDRTSGARDFHLEMHFASLEAFSQFCAILRGQNLDADTLARLTARLRLANDTEERAVAANTPTT